MKSNLKFRPVPLPRRSAFTLIEVLVTITVASSLMLLAVGMMHQALQLAHKTRDAAERSRTSRHFLDEFRRDVQSASSAQLDSPTQLVIRFSDMAQVVYTVDKGRVMREQRVGPEQLRHNELQLSESSRALLEELPAPRRLVLTLDKRPDIAGALILKGPLATPQTERRVEAMVGRWQFAVHSAEALR